MAWWHVFLGETRRGQLLHLAQYRVDIITYKDGENKDRGLFSNPDNLNNFEKDTKTSHAHSTLLKIASQALKTFQK